jgi:CAAX protease family protein
MPPRPHWFADEEGRPRTGWRVLAYLLVFALAAAAAGVVGHSLRGVFPRWLIGLMVTAIGGGGCVLGFWLLRVRVDRRPWAWVGLDASRRVLVTAGAGFASGVGMLGAVFLLEWALHWIEPGKIDTPGRISAVLGSLFAAMGIGLMEELLLRGAVLQNLGERLPLWAATLVTGLLFGLLHLANPAQHVTVAFVASAVVATLMLVLARFVTGSLGWAIGWHAGWDWMQDVLGIPNPGQDAPQQLLRIAQHGPVFWTGQAPSIEAGALPILVIAAAAVAFRALQARKALHWSWRRALLQGEPRPLA